MTSIEELLKNIIHPETGKDIISMGMVENLVTSDTKISLTLRFTKPHDPSAASLRRAITAIIHQKTGIEPSIIVADPAPANKTKEHNEILKQNSTTANIKKIIAISSAKGGVGKSSTTANLAITLAKAGYKVGVLDADIYGPSMPTMFGLADYTPLTSQTETLPNGNPLIEPAQKYGVKVMSIGFFIQPEDALIWRGPMATSALRQLLHQTLWGTLDFLLIDLPPGTGDVHLTLISEIKISAALIVTTPQLVALADVVRGITMFKSENVNIPVLGIVENMSFFAPDDQPHKKYYIFGKGKTQKVAEQCSLPIILSLPILEKMSDGADQGTPIALENSALFEPAIDCLVNC